MENYPVSNPKPKKSSRNAWIFIGVLILIPIIGIVIPVCMSDGTEGLSGIEKQAAKYALQEAESNVHGIDRISTMHLKVRVERVYATPSSEANGWCGYPTGQDTTGHYSTVVSYRSFFGIQTRQSVNQNCEPPFPVYNKDTGNFDLE